MLRAPSDPSQGLTGIVLSIGTQIMHQKILMGGGGGGGLYNIYQSIQFVFLELLFI